MSQWGKSPLTPLGTKQATHTTTPRTQNGSTDAKKKIPCVYITRLSFFDYPEEALNLAPKAVHETQHAAGGLGSPPVRESPERGQFGLLGVQHLN